jgi:hypothetical protein
MEKLKIKVETPQINEEALQRGKSFVSSLDALRQSLQGLRLGEETSPGYYFSPKSGQYMVVIPSTPIKTELLGFKYHKGTYVHDDITTSEPFVVSRLQINGLTDYFGKQSSLEFVGESPSWASDNGYTSHLWCERYTFNPLEHQIAIVDDNS